MTPASIQSHLFNAFKALYPTMPITITGAGEEHVEILIMMDGHRIVWECDVDSDDDGAFWFMLADTTLTLKVDYPEAV